ncbi:hypothetical protein VOLCADRAFT_98566 [Volvox carteri f. nagariensis]|uniref:Uncharacterized protein n=1 Tax=Volvox carteri f. nagariensis TaxID=3068 RepID=D8UFP4_VOLCA|nr:uncharacterized protein VOLCADRAFT_98566 [Volvox carteri f. nagariensis]EFJ41537.1 hypothetical protein VOLCADRAFT_98566 [Volvox carteri f. nagariensis]|eukprot:XP_002957482.1 hypothetical protein VOLCADRAFT_98566 [Volvox carteri f. nagariensis]
MAQSYFLGWSYVASITIVGAPDTGFAATAIGVVGNVGASDFDVYEQNPDLMIIQRMAENFVTLRNLKAKQFKSTKGTYLVNLSSRVSDLEKREAIAWQPRLRNLATQILLHACGNQEFRTTSSDYFAKLAEARDSGLQQVAAGMHMKLAQVATEADNVLTRQNLHVHSSSLEMLEAEVDAVRKCITIELEQSCPQECRFVHAYEVIKGAFPVHFKNDDSCGGQAIASVQ